MPIGIDRFDDADPDALPTSVRVLRFLSRNEEQAFRRGEIAEAVDASPETVGTNLTRLKERGLVRHREPYWAATTDRGEVRRYLLERYDDERVARFLDEDRESADADDERPSRAADDADEGPHREAAATFFRRVEEALGDAVEALYLFGSVARDGETASSDVDVLAVVADDADDAAVDDRLLDLAYDVQLEYGVSVEVHTLAMSEFDARRERGEPFVSTVLAEGTTRV